MTRKGDSSSLHVATRGMRKPNEAQKGFGNQSIPGLKKDGLRRAQQIVKQRATTPYVRDVPHCVSCLGPRERKGFPVCPSCTAKRLAGLR